MPKPRQVLNAFTAREVWDITGLSVHMLNYLTSRGYIEPAYGLGNGRGKVRYYSYRDLIIAKIVRSLCDSGIELRRLKQSILELSKDSTWFPKRRQALELIVTDGIKAYHRNKNGTLVELTPQRQQTFAFVLDVTKVQEEVKKNILPEKRGRFTLMNEPLDFAKEIRMTPRRALR